MDNLSRVPTGALLSAISSAHVKTIRTQKEIGTIRTKAKIFRFIRLMHIYAGVFIAPSVLFFAFTGALQTFSLHESSRTESYRPGSWIVVLAQIHKKQIPQQPAPNVRAPDLARGSGTPGRQQAGSTLPDMHVRGFNPLPLKIFPLSSVPVCLLQRSLGSTCLSSTATTASPSPRLCLAGL